MDMTDDQKVMYLTRPDQNEPEDLTPEQVLAQAQALQATLGLNGPSI